MFLVPTLHVGSSFAICATFCQSPGYPVMATVLPGCCCPRQHRCHAPRCLRCRRSAGGCLQQHDRSHAVFGSASGYLEPDVVTGSGFFSGVAPAGWEGFCLRAPRSDRRFLVPSIWPSWGCCSQHCVLQHGSSCGFFQDHYRCPGPDVQVGRLSSLLFLAFHSQSPGSCGMALVLPGCCCCFRVLGSHGRAPGPLHWRCWGLRAPGWHWRL